jgi:hypothetical protein
VMKVKVSLPTETTTKSRSIELNMAV